VAVNSSETKVHTTPEKFENGGSILKTHQMFSAHTARRRRNLKTQQSLVILDLCLRKTWSGKSRDYRDGGHRDAIIFGKLRFQSVFRPLENEKAAFSNSSGLKSVFESSVFVTD